MVGATYEGGFGTEPYTNMFGSDTGSIDQHYPANTLIGKFYKEHGATNVAVLGFSDPGSSATSKAAIVSMKKAGLKIGYENLSLVYGNVNFATEVVAMKNAGINAIFAPTSNTTGIGYLPAGDPGGHRRQDDGPGHDVRALPTNVVGLELVAKRCVLPDLVASGAGPQRGERRHDVHA